MSWKLRKRSCLVCTMLSQRSITSFRWSEQYVAKVDAIRWTWDLVVIFADVVAPFCYAKRSVPKLGRKFCMNPKCHRPQDSIRGNIRGNFECGAIDASTGIRVSRKGVLRYVIFMRCRRSGMYLGSLWWPLVCAIHLPVEEILERVLVMIDIRRTRLSVNLLCLFWKVRIRSNSE